jgi:hypothetical protein
VQDVSRRRLYLADALLGPRERLIRDEPRRIATGVDNPADPVVFSLHLPPGNGAPPATERRRAVIVTRAPQRRGPEEEGPMSPGRRLAAVCAAATLIVATTAGTVSAETVLRVVMHSDLKIIDPIWTTAYIVRNHGYMVYDTLFAMDANGEIRPQMVDKYDVSADKLTYALTLRDGLAWHDGKPVTAEDCVASIKRWSAKDSMGQKLMSFVKEFQVVNLKTFKIVLKEPTGLVLSALGKPSSNVPFMMPKRVAETDPNIQRDLCRRQASRGSARAPCLALRHEEQKGIAPRSRGLQVGDDRQG